MNQSRRAIWPRRQRSERGHWVTPHSLILSQSPFLLSSSLLLFSYSFFLVSFFCDVVSLHAISPVDTSAADEFPAN